MDPNNSQPIGTNPVQQPAVSQPVAQPVPAPAAQPVAAPIAPQPISPQNVAETPKKGGGKRIILIILILILIIGGGAYILFAKSQLSNTQKTSTNSNTGPIPQAPSIEGNKAPSISQPTSQDDLNIESPEADLQGLDAEVKGL